MNNFKNLNKMAIMALLVAPTLVGCSSDDPEPDNGGGGLGPLTPGNTEFGRPQVISLPQNGILEAN